MLSPRALPRRPCKVLLASLHSLSQQLDESEWGVLGGSGGGHPKAFYTPPLIFPLSAPQCTAGRGRTPRWSCC